MDFMAFIKELAQCAVVEAKQADTVCMATALDVDYHIKTTDGYAVCGYSVQYLENGNVILSKGKEWRYYADVEYL